MAQENYLKAIESIGRRLYDYLGKELVPDDENARYGTWLLDRPGSLHECLETELAHFQRQQAKRKYPKDVQPPSIRRLAALSFVSTDNTKDVHVGFDENPFSRRQERYWFGNYLSILSEDTGRHGDQLANRDISLVRSFFSEPIFDYGTTCAGEQYDAKNLDFTGGGAKAIGLDASKYLPGFYWGNYFGKYLCDRIGKELLLNVPGCNSEALGEGVLVTNELPLDMWLSAEFLRNERSAMDHIGRELFFEKGKPAPSGPLFSVS